MSDRLDAIAARSEDARRNRESYSKESRSRRITQEYSAKDVPRLLAAVRTVEGLADWHETKAEKARLYPGPDDLTVSLASVAIHADAARRIRRALTEALEGER